MQGAVGLGPQELEQTVERGVEQTLGYMAKCGADEGHLVVIDRRSDERKRGGDAEGRWQDGMAVWTL